MKRLIYMCVLGLSSLWASLAMAGPTITLRGEAQVSAPRIHLGAVARLQGFDRKSRAALARLDLGPSPRPGLNRVLTAAYLKTRLAGRTRGARLKLPERLVISRVTRTLKGTGLAATIRAHIEEAVPHPLEEIAEIRVDTPVDMVLPAGTETRVVLPEDSDFVGVVPVRVDHVYGAGQVRTQYVEAYVDLYVDVWQAGLPLRAGEDVSEDAVRRVRLPHSALPQDHITDLEQILGGRLTTHMKAGDVFRRRGVKPRPVVKRGDLVRIVIRSGAMKVTAAGEILSYEGALGAQVQVRNLSSNKRVFGRVTAPGEISIGGR